MEYGYEGTAAGDRNVGVKRQAIQSGAETAILLIRVEDMMVTQTRGPGGMPGM